MGAQRRRSDRAARPAMYSPGRPSVGRREERQRFWAAIARGVSTVDAAGEAGVSEAVGVRAFLSKDADRRDVCETIVAVARGEVVLPPMTHSGLAEQIRAHAGKDAPTLTPREREVLTPSSPRAPRRRRSAAACTSAPGPVKT